MAVKTGTRGAEGASQQLQRRPPPPPPSLRNSPGVVNDGLVDSVARTVLLVVHGFESLVQRRDAIAFEHRPYQRHSHKLLPALGTAKGKVKRGTAIDGEVSTHVFVQTVCLLVR